MYRVTGQLELAQEGINDVMLVVWEKGQTFTGRSTVSTWIMGIAYRKGLKLREKSKRWSDRFKAADIDDWNEPSINLCKKFGFEIEGRLRKAIFKDGKYFDELILAMQLDKD